MAESKDKQHERAVKVAETVTAAAASSGKYTAGALAEMIKKIHQAVRDLDNQP